MSALANYLPNSPKLITTDGKEVALTDLAGKLVFFYFSASWCPPCRGFTPQLVEFYNKYKEEKNFEIILVSWDEEEDAFKPYFSKMPWLAMPFADRKGQEHLTKGCNVQSIPFMVGVEADTGKVVTTTARNMVVKDPEGKEFPWAE